MSNGRRLRPILASDWSVVAARPVGLDDRLPGDGAPGDAPEHNACVDHHMFQSADGVWHLWGCVRRTKVGRILYRWEADRFLDRPWRDTGQFIRADRSAGECVRDWNGEEWLQSHYLFRTKDYYGRRTHVYRSEDPMDFGVGDASGKYVCAFPAAAVEIYEMDGREYVSSSHAPMLGTQMAELTWVEDRT